MMCIIRRVFTSSELKGLSKKKQRTLQRYGVQLVDTSPAVRNIIKQDPKVRKKLKSLLRPKYTQMKRA